MFNHAESLEHPQAYTQQLDRHIDCVAREIAVQRLLEPSNPDRGADPGQSRRSGLIDAVRRWRLPRRHSQEPSGV